MTQLHTFRKGRRYRSSIQFEDEFSEGVRKLPEKLKRWGAELVHSDLVNTASSETFKPASGLNDTDKDEDDELLRSNAHKLTEGHHELIDGELYIINDEELRRMQEECDTDEDDE